MIDKNYYFKEYRPSANVTYSGNFIRLGFELENFYNINWAIEEPTVYINEKPFLINKETGILEFDELEGVTSFKVDSHSYVVETLIKN